MSVPCTTQRDGRLFVWEDDEASIKYAGTMIGATGDYTFSALVYQGGDGRFDCTVRAFNHPDPTKTLPSGTAARHVVTAEGCSLQESARTLQDALVALLGPLDWLRWHLTEGKQVR